MIRSALLALDGSPASDVALRMAIELVKGQTRATPDGEEPVLLVGMSILDRPTITRPQALPLGAGAFKRDRDEALLAEADRKTREILDNFTSVCAEAGIAYDVLRAEGLPYEEIELASLSHDLILIGRDTNFHFQTSDDCCETAKRVLRDHPRPVLVVEDEVPHGDGLIIAYDGSRAAARALHILVLMGLNLGHLNVHVVSIDQHAEHAEANCRKAAELLNRHHIHAQLHPVASTANPAQMLIEKATELNAQVIVMGAFGHRGLPAAFFGSTTRRMLEQSPFPLFLYS
jgi:nucleotide-binding universal stress UspA family protein